MPHAESCVKEIRSVLWATSAGGIGLDLGFGIATDSPGNGYVTGHFQDRARRLGRGIATDHSGASHVTGFFENVATFGASETNETDLEAAGDIDVFVVKYRR